MMRLHNTYATGARSKPVQVKFRRHLYTNNRLDLKARFESANDLVSAA